MNITELKEKLTKFDKVRSWNQANLQFKFEQWPHQDWFERGGRFENEKNAKTITALLEIIKNQETALERYADERNWHTEESICDRRVFDDRLGDEYAIEDEEVCGRLAFETLTATEQKLKKLTEEK